MNIHEELKNIRKLKRITRKELANKLYTSPSLINEIESGRTRLSLDMFLNICKILEINPQDLIKENKDYYIILNKEDIDTIEKAINTLNKIKNQITKKEEFLNNKVNINKNNGNIVIGNNNRIIK